MFLEKVEELREEYRGEVDEVTLRERVVESVQGLVLTKEELRSKYGVREVCRGRFEQTERQRRASPLSRVHPSSAASTLWVWVARLMKDVYQNTPDATTQTEST